MQKADVICTCRSLGSASADTSAEPIRAMQAPKECSQEQRLQRQRSSSMGAGKPLRRARTSNQVSSECLLCSSNRAAVQFQSPSIFLARGMSYLCPTSSFCDKFRSPQPASTRMCVDVLVLACPSVSLLSSKALSTHL